MALPLDQDSDTDNAPAARIGDTQQKTQASTLPAESWHTQPTQIIRTPHKPVAHASDQPQQASPAVQVAASSPPPAYSPQPRVNGTSNSRASAMAPPGTVFRHPSQHTASQMHSQAQTTQALDHDIGMISDSSDEGKVMKPAYFEKGGPGANGINRVDNSPQSAFKSAISQYKHGAALKRPPPPGDLVSAYASSQSSKKPRTQGPSRAVQQVDMTLDDIFDSGLRSKAHSILIVFNCTVRRAHDALLKKRGNYDDALAHIAAEDEAATNATQTAVILSDSDSETSRKPQAKQTVARTGTIADRYGSKAQSRTKPTGQSPLLERTSPVAQKKKRKLVRGAQSRIVSPTPAQSPLASSPAPVRSRVRNHPSALESDSESTQSAASGARPGSDSDSTSGLEAQLLDLVNTARASALLDLSGASKDDVACLMSARPFAHLDAVRAICKELPSKGKRKPRQVNVGDRLVDSCLDILSGYDALNKLVSVCEDRGRPVLEKMRAWGLANFGQSTDGELEMTKVQTDESLEHQLTQPSNMSHELTMKDYQLAGLNWLSLLYSNGLSAILADDMGLGKTCQVIAFLAQLKLDAEKDHCPRDFAIVIVPGSTLENWLREIESFCPDLICEPYYGAQKDRYEKQVAIKNSVDNKEIDVMVTTYDMASKNDDAKFLRSLKPDICVYDEAHHLKNSTTTRYRQLMQIRVRKMRILLTGTPLQNNLVELSSLLGFLMPDIFEKHKGDLESVFSARAKVNTSQEQEIIQDNDDEQHDELLSSERIGRARRMLTPFILRRKKDQVLKQLPTKTNTVEYCRLSGAHKSIYSDAFAAYSNQGGDDGSKLAMKSSLINLRKAAIHPLLFRRHYDDQAVEFIAQHHTDLDYPPASTPKAEYRKRYQQYREYYAEMSDFEIHKAIADTLPKIKHMKLRGEPWLDSDKIKALLVILDRHAEAGDTTLIFSQFTSVMDILEAVFETRDIPFYRLDGQTDMNTRQQLIDDFTAASSTESKTARKPVFMLSTRAGGQGINLTVANRVVIFDSGFNPQDDVQAENRAHRVGQTRPVEVVRLVARGTVEEAILALGERKLKLDAMVAGAGGGGTEGAAMVGKLLAEKCKVELDSQESANDAVTDDNVVQDERQIDVKRGEDMGESFMKGLKTAGLDMQAAARKPLKR